LEYSEDEVPVIPPSPPTSPPPVASSSSVKQEMIPGWVRIPVIVSFTEASPEPYAYEIMDDELFEDNELTIPGESHFDCPVDETDEVPVRLLSDFTIYDMSTNIVIPIAELLMLSCNVLGRKNYGASGIAKAWTDTEDWNDDDLDDEDEDENELPGVSVPTMGERVKLSEILTFDIHHYSEGAKSLDRFVCMQMAIHRYFLIA